MPGCRAFASATASSTCASDPRTIVPTSSSGRAGFLTSIRSVPSTSFPSINMYSVIGASVFRGVCIGLSRTCSFSAGCSMDEPTDRFWARRGNAASPLIIRSYAACAWGASPQTPRRHEAHDEVHPQEPAPDPIHCVAYGPLLSSPNSVFQWISISGSIPLRSVQPSTAVPSHQSALRAHIDPPCRGRLQTCHKPSLGPVASWLVQPSVRVSQTVDKMCIL